MYSVERGRHARTLGPCAIVVLLLAMASNHTARACCLDSTSIAAPLYETGAAQPDIEWTIERSLDPGWKLEASSFIDFGFRSERMKTDDLLTIETFAIEAAEGATVGRIGRFAPRFGWAWERFAGPSGETLRSEYELADRWTFEAGRRVGETLVAVSASFRDTTLLSTSLGTREPELRKSDGGFANTGRPESLTLSVDGSVPIGTTSSAYRLSFLRDAAGRGGQGDRLGVAAGVHSTWLESSSLHLSTSLESAWLERIEEGQGSALYLSAGIEAAIGIWRGRCLYESRKWRGKVTNALEGSLARHLGSEAWLEVGFSADLARGERGTLALMRITRSFSF